MHSGNRSLAIAILALLLQTGLTPAARAAPIVIADRRELSVQGEGWDSEATQQGRGLGCWGLFLMRRTKPR